MTRLHFTLIKIWIFVAVLASGCVHGGLYPPATLPIPPEPVCEYEGIIVENVKPETALCGLAQRKIKSFLVHVAPKVPEIDVRRLKGYIITQVEPKTTATTFYSDFWQKEVKGETWCQYKRIKVATIWYSIPHELAHAGEGCPREENEPDLERALHPDWDQRGITVLVNEADNF